MTRVLTAATGLAILLVTTTWAPRWMFAALVSGVGLLALDEFLGIAGAGGLGHPGRWWLVPGAGLTLSWEAGPQWTLWGLVGCVLLLGVVSLGAGRSIHRLEYLSTGVAGAVYTSLLAGFVLTMSAEAFWVMAATVWAGDTAAYYGGCLLGRHRLAPRVSPNKTVEGAVSGAVSSVVIGTVAGALLMSLPLPFAAGVCLLTGVAGQLGDLAESAMKRAAGVKDSGRRLPGHGGVLDRIDSLLFAGPVFHLLTLWAR